MGTLPLLETGIMKSEKDTMTVLCYKVLENGALLVVRTENLSSATTVSFKMQLN